MTTSSMFTAPIWSADPLARLDTTVPAGLVSDQVRDTVAAHLPVLDAALAAARAPWQAMADLQHRQHDPTVWRDLWATLLLAWQTGSLHQDPRGQIPPLQTSARTGVKRLLSPVETVLVRVTVLGARMAAVQVGLLEAGAAPGELAEIEVADLTFDGEDWWVQLPGGVGPGGTPITARPACLPTWVHGPLAALAGSRGAHRRLVYGGRSADPAARTSSVLMSIGKQLKVAGLAQDRRVRPASIRLTAARAVFDQSPSHPLEAAGEFLGTDSYDAMARALHLPM